MRSNQNQTNPTPTETHINPGELPPKATEIQTDLASHGPAVAVDHLINSARQNIQPRILLDALLLKSRLKLGLPATGTTADQMPEELKTKYEDQYVEAIRQVGQLLLDSGDITAAWPYFRVIGEKDPVRTAIEKFDPSNSDEHTLGAIIDVAFQQQVHPVKGFAWILDRYGICSAISSFEAMPADDSVRSEAAAMLTRSLYEQLHYSLASEIERRESTRPSAENTVSEMLNNRSWIYDDDAYAIDVSHLSSVVRLSPLLKNESDIRLALQLAEYGQGLSDRFRYDGLPPFEDVYRDHSIYLNALLGNDTENAIDHFRNKIQPPFTDDDQQPDPLDTLPAQTLVRLLNRLGKTEQAILLASEHLMKIPESYLLCPSVPALCRSAKRPDLLARAAAQAGDWPLFLAAKIEELSLEDNPHV